MIQDAFKGQGGVMSYKQRIYFLSTYIFFKLNIVMDDNKGQINVSAHQEMNKV